MKSIIAILICCFISFDISAQGSTIEYNDYFGHKLILHQDSSFRFTWNFDLAASWSIGNWRISNDTIYLKVINVYDTLLQPNGDTLVLSMDEKPNRIDGQQFAISTLSGGGQNRVDVPSKLCYKGRRLFLMTKDGTLVRKKVYGMSRQKKYPPWYKLV